jgi:hypothetical protein
MRICKTPGTNYSIEVHGNQMTYVVTLPDNKVITGDIAEELENVLHDQCEKILAYRIPRKWDTCLNYLADKWLSVSNLIYGGPFAAMVLLICYYQSLPPDTLLYIVVSVMLAVPLIGFCLYNWQDKHKKSIK